MPPVTMKKAIVPKHSGQLSEKGHSGKLITFLTQIAILALWKTLWTLSIPIGKFIALQLWLGKSFVTVSFHLQHQLLKAIGWLSSPSMPAHAKLARAYRRNMGTDLKNWHMGVATIVAVGVISSAFKKWKQHTDDRFRRMECLRKRMASATSYEAWRQIAEQLYKLETSFSPEGEAVLDTRLYDRKLLLDKTNHLRRIRATGNVKEIMFGLRTDLIRNIANIAKSQRHEHFVVIPPPIQQYLAEMKSQLGELMEWNEGELAAEDKLSFFRETRHTFGRTALLLSGGGSLGTFHIGVAKALFEQRLLPRVLAGSSVGSIVCGIIATRTDAELRDLFSRLDQFDIGFFSNSRAMELLHHLINKGSLQDITFLVKKLRNLLGDCTFLEAYERTGRILNVTVCPADTVEPPRLLNYLTAPHALIWSAVAASSAFPGLFPAQNLLARNSRGEVVQFSAQSTNDSLERRWRDGSLELDLPVQALGEMFNCNHYLVSQTNPHIVPLLNLKKAFSRKWANIMEAELKHRCQVLQWLLPDWVPSKWLNLFTQPWEGDITMILPTALWDIGKTIINPTTAELLRSVKVGEVATWEKLSAIECNCSIEATLDKCLANITNQVRGFRLHRTGNRIPSWLHMPAVGLPAVASWGEDIDAVDAEDEVPRNASWGAGKRGDSPVLGQAPGTPVHGGVASSSKSFANLPALHVNGINGHTTPRMSRSGLTTGPGSSRSNFGSYELFARASPMRAATASVAPLLPTWTDTSAESECGSEAGMPSGTSSGFGSSINADVDLSGSGASAVSPSLLEMAYCDCTDPSVSDLWSQLLPLASQSVGLGEIPVGAGAGESIDVFAY